MRTQQEFLKDLIGRLERDGIPYMIAGSLGSAFHGEPRSTHDVDLVIDPTASQLEAFVSGLKDSCYVSPGAAREALARRRMFNVIDAKGTWKADFIIRKDRPFSREEFNRRRVVTFLDMRAALSSPEDVILSKLEWANQGDSERQLRDVAGVILGQWGKLDEPYLRRWARELGVEPLLDRVWAEAARARPDESPGA